MNILKKRKNERAKAGQNTGAKAKYERESDSARRT